MAAPEEIAELVERFDSHRESYKSGQYNETQVQYIYKLPIYIINFSDSAEKTRHDRIADLSGQMLFQHQQLAATKLDHDKNTLRRQIDATDRQIDRLVYELYGLTEEEIKIVENS
jgi:hypothetical protein